MSHTPGPWHVTDSKHDLQVAECRSRLVIAERGGIAWVFLKGKRTDNASLISAAPELLAACLQIHDDVNRFGELRGSTMNQIDAAIAKAKGQS